MSTIFRAAWVCPVAQAPVRDGWVEVEDGRITRVGGEPDAPPGGSVRDLGRVALMPGVVNAHTHLELSGLRGNVPPAAVFTDWVKQLMAVRGGRRERADDQSMIDASRSGCREAREFGTALIGDITNSLTSIIPLLNHGLRGLVFHELLGFNLAHGRSVADTAAARQQAKTEGGNRVKVSLAPHAPYSVSPELFTAIRAAVDANDPPIMSVHLAESDGEVQFLESGTGPWPGLLRLVGSWRDDWPTPGCGPVEYLDRMHMLDSGTLVVHGVHLGREALSRLATLGCTVVTCPRSNQWVGAGAPPIARFYESGVRVAVGTDSLASVDDLNIFAELKTMRSLAPGVPAATLLHSATLAGAEALGFASEIGSIEPGKAAELIAIELPSTLDRQVAAPAIAVEEFLVSGITARQIAWVTA
ncbi:MAG TPA: amidohydrolase family protein [Vicinamibacterales bacterium]|nr:amidohydrolase family protein [Vicinamibacterales bacterium]